MASHLFFSFTGRADSWDDVSRMQEDPETRTRFCTRRIRTSLLYWLVYVFIDLLHWDRKMHKKI